MGDWAVRRAGPADAEALRQVHAEGWRATYAGILPALAIDREVKRRRASGWGPILSEKGLAAVLVAESPEAGIVGFATVGDPREAIADLEAEIAELYVLPAHQGRGVGRALVEAAARHFVLHGLFGFYVWVLRSNRARFFYETLGGEPVLEKTGAVGGHPYGLVAYAWHDLTRLVTGADAPGALPPIG